MYRHLLVPIDDTPLADQVTEQAVAFAREIAARITFLHVPPDFGATDDGALLHAVAPGLFARHADGRAPLLLARAQASAESGGVSADAVTARGNRPHEVILDVARERQCDLIYMASHGRRGLRGILLGSVTQRLLQQTDRPVLVAAVEVNLPMSAEQRAVSIIRAEHRSMAAVIQALRHTVNRAIEEGRPPDIKLVRAMLYYIQEFAERLHRPKEEQYLFEKLSQRTSECDELITQLIGQHAQAAERTDRLRSLLDDFERGANAAALTRLQQLVEEVASEEMRHTACEERLILPVANRWLKVEDWDEIAAAFSENGDPRFGAESDEAFERLSARLLRLSAATGRSGRAGQMDE